MALLCHEGNCTFWKALELLPKKFIALNTIAPVKANREITPTRYWVTSFFNATGTSSLGKNELNTLAEPFVKARLAADPAPSIFANAGESAYLSTKPVTFGFENHCSKEIGATRAESLKRGNATCWIHWSTKAHTPSTTSPDGEFSRTKVAISELEVSSEDKPKSLHAASVLPSNTKHTVRSMVTSPISEVWLVFLAAISSCSKMSSASTSSNGLPLIRPATMCEMEALYTSSGSAGTWSGASTNIAACSYAVKKRDDCACKSAFEINAASSFWASFSSAPGFAHKHFFNATKPSSRPRLWSKGTASSSSATPGNASSSSL